MPFQVKEVCGRGHKLEGENLYLFVSKGKTKRKCRACISINAQSVSTKESAKRWAANNKPRLAETSRRYRERHKDRARDDGRRSEQKRRTEKREEWLAGKRKWNFENRERVDLYARRSLCKKHGVSVAEYESLYNKQCGKCAICGMEESESRFLSIDHRHECCPGKFSCGKCIRGLLCNKCNQGIGCLRDNVEILKKAIKYLRRTKCLPFS